MEEFRRSTVHPAKRGRSLGWLTLAVPLLFACGQNANVPVNPDPYAGGVSYPWAYTAPADTVNAQSLTAEVNSLSFEKILSAKNGWGPIERDRSNGEQKAGDGRTLSSNGGKAYARGFGVHAGSELRFSLKGVGGATCKRFASDIGIDDETATRGSVVFQVYLDGVKAFDSGVVVGGGVNPGINIDVTGKKELRLVVTDAGDGISYDHADWLNPQVDCGAKPSGTLDASFGVGGIANIGGVDTAIEPDGSVLYASGKNGQFVVTRRRPDGQLATNRIALSSTPNAIASGILRQTNGKIVLVGGDETKLITVRFNADLSVDTSFGTGGVVMTARPAPIAYGFGATAVQQSDGQLLVAGSTTAQLEEGTFPATMLARYRQNGQLDPSLGQGGNFGAGGVAVIEAFITNSLAVQPDGKILLGGSSPYSSGSFEIVRVLPSGTVDTTFGGEGRVYGGNGACVQVVSEPGGTILAVGSDGGKYDRYAAIKRYSPSGAKLNEASVNLLEDQGGFLQNSFNGLLRQPDGRILVIGRGSNENSVTDTNALLRFKSDLTPDATFTLGDQADTIAANNLLEQPDGKLILTNSTQTARYFP